LAARRHRALAKGCHRAVLANFRQVVKDKPIRIHPIVSQLVDPAVLEKMKVKPVSEAESSPDHKAG
jgi:hypothetical protein